MNGYRVCAGVAELHATAASLMVEAAGRAIAERGRCLLVLAGGTTPRGVYEQVAAHHAAAVDWERVHVFWGDERCVPPDHPQSNYRMAADSLLDRVAIPARNVHRMEGEHPAQVGAARYQAELETFFAAASPAQLAAGGGFDLVLLGIGTDGHTASLFPGTAALRAVGWAAAAAAPPSAAVRERITLTFAALNTALEVLFLASGGDKRPVVEQVVAPAEGDPSLPAGRIRPVGTVRWLLDAAAAPRSERGR